MIIQETPTLNLQFDKAKNDSDMLSLLKSQGGTFTRGSEVVGSGDSVASYVDALGILRYAKLGHPRPNFVAGVNQGLLIEEARTNLLERSEEFDNAYWTKAKSGAGLIPVVTPNDAIAPDGTLSGDKVVFNRVGNTASDMSQLSASPTFTVGVTYNSSFYIKASEASEVGKELAFRSISSGAYGPNIILTADWVRYDLNQVAVSGGTYRFESRGTINADANVSVHIWGAQLE